MAWTPPQPPHPRQPTAKGRLGEQDLVVTTYVYRPTRVGLTFKMSFQELSLGSVPRAPESK